MTDAGVDALFAELGVTCYHSEALFLFNFIAVRQQFVRLEQSIEGGSYRGEGRHFLVLDAKGGHVVDGDSSSFGLCLAIDANKVRLLWYHLIGAVLGRFEV